MVIVPTQIVNYEGSRGHVFLRDSVGVSRHGLSMHASIEVENETNDDRSGSKIVNYEGFKRFQLFLRLECGYLATRLSRATKEFTKKA